MPDFLRDTIALPHAVAVDKEVWSVFGQYLCLRMDLKDRTNPCRGCRQREVECICEVSVSEDGFEGTAEHTDAGFPWSSW